MNNIRVSYFHIPKESLDNAILAWWVSRTEDNFDKLEKRLYRLMPEEYNKWLGDILQQDLPIREFVPVFFVVENCPRALQDQIDRSRWYWAFWEQSLRVKDLESNFEYFTPVGYETGYQLYHNFMETARKTYAELINEHKWNRDLARGVAPLHINVRLSAQTNLRSLLNLLSSRMCFFAQSSYWQPVIQGLLDGLWKAIPALKERNILTLPCSGKNNCSFEKDLLDRIADFSNPICPLLIDKFCPKEYSQIELIAEMCKRYPNYIEDSKKYAESVNEKINF